MVLSIPASGDGIQALGYCLQGPSPTVKRLACPSSTGICTTPSFTAVSTEIWLERLYQARHEDVAFVVSLKGFGCVQRATSTWGDIFLVQSLVVCILRRRQICSFAIQYQHSTICFSVLHR